MNPECSIETSRGMHSGTIQLIMKKKNNYMLQRKEKKKKQISLVNSICISTEVKRYWWTGNKRARYGTNLFMNGWLFSFSVCVSAFPLLNKFLKDTQISSSNREETSPTRLVSGSTYLRLECFYGRGEKKKSFNSTKEVGRLRHSFTWITA